MDFHPPIASRSTEELLKMASDAATWQPEARALARMELDRRVVPVQVVETREQEFKAASGAHRELLERHAQEGYSLRQLVGIFLIAPLLIIGKIIGRKVFLDVKLGLSELDRRNYKKKYRQRVAMLIAGSMFWFIVLAAIPD